MSGWSPLTDSGPRCQPTQKDTQAVCLMAPARHCSLPLCHHGQLFGSQESGLEGGPSRLASLLCSPQGSHHHRSRYLPEEQVSGGPAESHVCLLQTRSKEPPGLEPQPMRRGRRGNGVRFRTGWSTLQLPEGDCDIPIRLRLHFIQHLLNTGTGWGQRAWVQVLPNHLLPSTRCVDLGKFLTLRCLSFIIC